MVYTSCSLVQVVIIKRPCTGFHQFVLQLFCLGSQLLQLLLLDLDLLVC